MKTKVMKISLNSYITDYDMDGASMMSHKGFLDLDFQESTVHVYGPVYILYFYMYIGHFNIESIRIYSFSKTASSRD